MDGVAEEGEGSAGVRPGVHAGADLEFPLVDAFTKGEEFGDSGVGVLVVDLQNLGMRDMRK